MSLPTLEELRTGSTTWRRTYKGINYTLSHHGVCSYKPKGTWCFYIHLLEGMFINADDFAKFYREPIVSELGSGSFYETHAYNDVPDYGFHSGITFYSLDNYVDRDGKKYRSIKMGCDYSHLWDEESGYWQGLEDVANDAKNYIDGLVGNVPFKKRCAYSGKIDAPDQFYESEKGLLVHNSYLEKMIADGHPAWLPKKQEAE